MSKPTPTQSENDAAALGQHVLLKEFDDSSLDLAAKPPEDTPPPEPEPKVEPEPKAEDDEQKTLSFEPLPNPIGYKTRAFKPTDDAGED